MLEINARPDQTVWITSDTHFGHKNICRGTTQWDLERAKNSVRDFDTLEEMNNTLITNINDRVDRDDILIHDGDWSFGGFDNIKLFRDRINCQNIHLITGNHDHHIVKNKNGIREIFSSVTEFYTRLKLTQNGDTHVAVLSHFPIASWDGMNDGVVHLFGHVHLPIDKKIMQGRSMDVGVDGSDFIPHPLLLCIKLLEMRPILPTVLPHDHHSVDVKK